MHNTAQDNRVTPVLFEDDMNNLSDILVSLHINEVLKNSCHTSKNYFARHHQYDDTDTKNVTGADNHVSLLTNSAVKSEKADIPTASCSDVKHTVKGCSSNKDMVFSHIKLPVNLISREDFFALIGKDSGDKPSLTSTTATQQLPDNNTIQPSEQQTSTNEPQFSSSLKMNNKNSYKVKSAKKYVRFDENVSVHYIPRDSSRRVTSSPTISWKDAIKTRYTRLF